MGDRRRMPDAMRVGSVRHLGKGRGGSGAKLIANVALFAGLSERDRRRIADLADEAWFGPGAVLVEEGEPGDAFFAILDGTVRVTRSGAARALRILGAGDHFGELALIDGHPRSATVVAETSVDAIRIGRTAFQRLLREQPEVGLRIMAQLSTRLREFERQLVG